MKSRIVFTLLLLGICRVVAWIPVPGLDASALKAFFDANANQVGGSLIGLYSLFTGGALQNCAIGSLGIMPYITASIILQLLTVAVPSLERLQKEGEVGPWCIDNSYTVT